MEDPFDFLLYGSLTFFAGVPAMLPVVVISIRVDMQTFQQPVDAKPLRILINKLVSIYLLSFAKNSADFFRKSFSFLSSSFSFWSL